MRNPVPAWRTLHDTVFRTALLIPVLVFSITFTASARPASWDFESGADGWCAAGAATVTVAVGAGEARTGKRALRIEAADRPGSRLAQSDPRTMMEIQHYRVTAWVRPGRTQGGMAPRLECEFLTREGALGRETVGVIDSARPGVWQMLSAELRAPLGTESCRLFLAVPGKPGGKVGAGRCTVSLDDLSLEPIEHFTVEGKYALDPIPPKLSAARGVHPRLYLTRERLAGLREAIKTTHAAQWVEVRDQADKLVGGSPAAYRAGTAEDGHDEQLWQRPVGEQLPLLAMAYLLTGDRKYLDNARERALAACRYRTWGTGDFEGTDLSAAHLLFGLAVLYDWCHDDLGEPARRTIRETIRDRGGYLFERAASGTIVTDAELYRVHPWPEWDTAYLQNHQWIGACALAVSAAAVFDEVPEVLPRIGFALDRYRKVFTYLPGDGSFHEGAPYWGYGLEYMLKFMEVSRNLFGENFYDRPWLRETAAFRLYLSLPRNSWTPDNLLVDIGDSPRRDWYGPEYMLRRLAGEYRDSRAQWIAGEIDRANCEKPIARWLNLLWFDPSLPEKPPAGLPTLHRFPDTEIVTARSDWSGDESFVMFKCGPYIGHHAIHAMPYCPSSAHHVHPDAGNFVIFGEGEWLVREDGYLGKYTGQHNTLLVNGAGQMGEGGPIFDGVRPHARKAEPRILRAESGPALDHIAGDAAPAYAPKAGLKKYTRHLLFLKPDILIVADDIALSRPGEMELRFHPEQPKGERTGNAYVYSGKQAVLRLDVLTPAAITLDEQTLELISRENKRTPINTVRLVRKAATWRNATAFSWAETGASPVKVTVDAAGDRWTFRAANRTVTLDWRTGEAEVK